MSRRYFTNNASVVELVSEISSSATSCQVTDASSFPATYPWAATIDAGQATAECVLVTDASGATLTITRGYDGTAAQAHAANASFAHTATKADYDEANQHVNANSNVHGVVGSVVGTSDAQTLSNKTIAGPTLTGTVDASSADLLGVFHAGMVMPAFVTAAPTGWLMCDGSKVSRSTYSALLTAVTVQFTATLTSGAKTIGSPSITLDNYAFTGEHVEGTGVPAGTTMNKDLFSGWQLSNPASASGTVTLTLYPLGNGDGSTTFTLPDLRGRVLRGANSSEPLGQAAGSDTHSHALSSQGWADVFIPGGGGAAINQVASDSWTENWTTGSGRSSGTASNGYGAALGGATNAQSALPSHLKINYIIKH